MTKKIIITLLAAMMATASFAQSGKSAKEVRKENFVYGPKVGLSMPYQHIVTNTADLNSLLGGPNLGVQLGGYIRGIAPFGKSKFSFYGQLEATWAMDFYFGGGGNAQAGCFNFPLLVGGGYTLNNDLTFRVGLGPTYTVNMYNLANPAFKDVDGAYADKVAEMTERNPWGWTVDLGADYKDWTVALRYMNQFASKDIFRIADEYRFISVGLTIGYRF